MRALLDVADFKTWTEDTVKFRQLTRRRTVKFAPAKQSSHSVTGVAYTTSR